MGVLIIRILLFRVLCLGKLPYPELGDEAFYRVEPSNFLLLDSRAGLALNKSPTDLKPENRKATA